jgi:hypothetical protein
METLKYAPIEDIMSAFDIIHEQDTTKAIFTKIFDLHSALSFINFGCIKNTDHVLVMMYNYEIITWITSYLYAPNQLVTYLINFESKSNHSKWEDFHLLLNGYQYTKPVFSSIDINGIEAAEELFDVAIVGCIYPSHHLTEIPGSRFYLEIGEEYERFEKYLIGASDNLKENGVLVLLSKPGWILKAWNLLEDLNLQLEYNDYKLYLDKNRGPNTLVWLRFVKMKNDRGTQLKKKNILNLMRDNNIDRLFAHRNNLIFPYVKLPDYPVEPYVDLDEDLEYKQYFFTLETTRNLSKLCNDNTACLVTPSVAQCAYKEGKNIVLFERDNRFREKGGLKFVKYDLYKGLSKLLYNKYLNKLDKVICDPPFNIKLDNLSNDIDELLKRDNNSIAYIVFPCKDKAKLVNAMKKKGFYLADEPNQISIEYTRPPKIVRLNGKDAIMLYKFTYV